MDLRTLLIHFVARIVLAVIYGVLLIKTGAPPWAYVLALIGATYWGPPRDRS